MVKTTSLIVTSVTIHQLLGGENSYHMFVILISMAIMTEINQIISQNLLQPLMICVSSAEVIMDLSATLLSSPSVTDAVKMDMWSLYTQ